MKIEEKIAQLQAHLRTMGSVLVTFSGGVDSCLLAKLAHEALAEKAYALTAVSESLPQAELEETKQLAQAIGIQHILVETAELDNPNYAENPVNRCYFCKSELYAVTKGQAQALGVAVVVDGTHLSDLNGPRPGRQAASEWQVQSPFIDLEWTKAEIREASQHLGLATWDKPEMACLASRIPTGVTVTKQRLNQVEAAEQNLKALGFRQLRVRFVDQVARVELAPEEMTQLSESVLHQVQEACERAGFERTWIDLQGYKR